MKNWALRFRAVDEDNFEEVRKGVKSVDEMKKIYASYPDYEKKIKEYGLFGFKFE